MKVNPILYVFAAVIYIFSCSEPEIAPLDAGKSQDNDVQKISSSVAPLSFPTRKWWSFFPRSVSPTNYITAYSADGITWPAATPTNALLLWPDWVKAVYLNGQIHLFYHHNGNYYLNKSSDGLNWQSPQVISGITASPNRAGRINYPEIAVINNEIYAFKLSSNHQPMHLQVLKFEGYGFNSINPYGNDLDLDVSEDFLSPSYAKLNGKHYVVFRYGGDGAGMYWSESTDLSNWSPAIRLCTVCQVSGSATDATASNGFIYVTFKKSDNTMCIVKFDGSVMGSTFIMTHNSTVLKTSGINIPIDTDGSKIVVSYRGNGGNDKNYVVYSTNGATSWNPRDVPSSSSWARPREILYVPN